MSTGQLNFGDGFGMAQVETMSVELEAKKITVATAQKDCEELLVEIVSERRVADEQKKQVRAHSTAPRKISTQ